MDAKRLVIGTVVGAITLSVTGILIFDVLLASFYESNLNDPGILRESQLVWAISVSSLLFALLNSRLKLVLLEHPTRGLDVRSSDWIWELLYRRREEGTAIIFISADLDEVIDRSDRIAVFSAGRMSRLVQASETSIDELGRLIGGQI